MVSASFAIGYVVTSLGFADYLLAFGLCTETRATELNDVDKAFVAPVQRFLQFVFPSLLEHSKLEHVHRFLQSVSIWVFISGLLF